MFLKFYQSPNIFSKTLFKLKEFYRITINWTFKSRSDHNNIVLKKIIRLLMIKVKAIFYKNIL